MRINRTWFWYLIVALACPALLLAQARPAPSAAANAQAKPAPKPALPPTINVVKTDGSVVKGQFAGADHDGVSLRPFVTGKPAADPVIVKWSDVKSVSNGLTRQKAIDQWKSDHKDELCPECKGDRLVTCQICKGVGHDPAASKDCKTCGGELLIDCKAPKCEQGKIPCPKPCLKLTDPGWVKKPDGLRWKTFGNPRTGQLIVSERHLGQIVTIKDGVPQEPVTCETCGGTTKVDCPTCHGTAKVPCPTCKANKAAPDCSACDDGLTACKTCGGTGLKKQGA
jgi:hypothetical protein